MTLTRDSEEIYLDYAATTPLAPEVLRVMDEVLVDSVRYGNPSSLHVAGRRSHALIESARATVGVLINAPPRTIIFTSGATEADNLAVRGGARFRAHRGRHIITMATEHKAVLASAAALEDEGFEVTRVEPGPDGLLSLDTLRAAVRPDTQLVSVMHVNNETGVVQNLAEIGGFCREHDILFHSDAAQSAGKLPIDVTALPVDLVSLSGHKFHGPQGIGALYVADRPGCGVQPIQQGGSQERRLRAGTEPVALIAGFARAAELATASMQDDLAHTARLGRRLWRHLEAIDGVRRNGSCDRHYPGILNVSADGVEGESLMLALEPLCVASGSACNAQSGDASFVLKALGLSDLQAQAAIRFSFGRYTSDAEIDRAASLYGEALTRLRAISATEASAA